MTTHRTLTVDEYRAEANRTRSRSRSKYRNVRTEYAGRLYDSRAEAAQAARLDHQVRTGLVRFWLPQVPVPLGLDDGLRVDFLVIDTAGYAYAVEVKGRETRDFARKKRLWLKYGPCRLVIVYRDRETAIEGGGACRRESSD